MNPLYQNFSSWMQQSLHTFCATHSFGETSLTADDAQISLNGRVHGLDRIYMSWCGADGGPSSLIFDLYPADLVAQGRVVFANLDLPAFLRLQMEGWQLAHNFTLRFKGNKIVSAEAFAPVPVEAYCRFWQQHPQYIVSFTRCDQPKSFDPLITMLREASLLTPEAELAIWQKFVGTHRGNANVCPSLHLRMTLPLPVLSQAKEAGILPALLQACLAPVPQTWGETLFR